jgi:hypothetical protein
MKNYIVKIKKLKKFNKKIFVIDVEETDIMHLIVIHQTYK